MSRLEENEVRSELERLAASRDDYDRLGVSRDANRETLRKVFITVSMRFHPDLHTLRSAQFRERVQEVFMQLSEAEQRLAKRIVTGRSPTSDLPPTRPISAETVRPSVRDVLGHPSPVQSNPRPPSGRAVRPSSFAELGTPAMDLKRPVSSSARNDGAGRPSTERDPPRPEQDVIDKQLLDEILRRGF